MFRRSRFAALIALLWSEPLAGASVESLVAELTALQAEHRIPAIGLAISTAGRSADVRVWGRTGNPSSPDAGADTPFRLGSITKTFTALSLAAAVAEGGLSLEAPLDRVVGSGTHENPFEDRPIRLRHLVEHTAGFTDLSREEFDYADPRPLSLSEALGLAPASRRAWWPPGTRHAYSNVGAGLSALAIERLSGETYEGFTTRAVLSPLGMTHASFFPMDTMARGFRAAGAAEIPYWNMTFRAYGALNASTAEVARFLDVLVHDGVREGERAIAPAAMAALRRPESTLAAAAGLGIGYGLGMYGWVSHGHVFWGHGGDADGYRSRYGWLPDFGRAYFVVINADDPATLNRMQRTIEAHLVADLPRPIPPERRRLDAAELARWAGSYYPSSTRFRTDAWRERRRPVATIVVEGDDLVFRSGRATRLVPVGEQLFRREADPVASVAFIEVELSEPRVVCTHLQGELGNFVRLDPGVSADLQNRCIWE
jgi:CubicO group peptidase (beta-lactamase class C family)